MKKYIAIGIFIIAIIVFGVTTTISIERDKEISSKLWVEDISYLDETIKIRHPDLFRNISEEEWNKEIESLKKDVNKLSDTEILLRISNILSELDDGHTEIPIVEVLSPITSESINIDDTLIFPIKINEFKDGFRVVECDNEYKNVLGYKLISINNVKTEDILKEVATLVSGDNDQGKKQKAIKYINSFDILKFLNIVENEVASFEFETDKKEKVTIKMNVKKIKDLDQVKLDKKTSITEKKPSKMNDFYWFENFEDDNILYFQYNKCISNDSTFLSENARKDAPSFSEFEKSLINEINNSEFDKFIIDLRNNRGGSLGLSSSLITNLENKTDIENKDIYMFVGKDTLSAGVITAYQLKEHFDITILGEETGGNINLFTTYPEKDIITLPNSGKKIRYSSSFANYSTDGDKGVKPDIEIIQSFEGYVNGIDDLYEYVRK